MARFIKPLWFRLLLIVAVLLLLIYVGDYISLVYRIPNGREQFGSVQVDKSFAVKLKDQKTEYMFEPPQTEQCVHSLFPHFGSAPCWYLERHAEQQTSF